MKTRPILFNAEMVRAILDGSKTQTRREAPIETLGLKRHHSGLLSWGVKFTKPIKGGVLSSHSGGNFTEGQAVRIIASQFCPIGSVGDKLYVRETWAAPADLDGTKPSLMPEKTPVIYAASRGKGALSGVWRPSIHMPKWASRITLEIVGVRIERLNTISEADAWAEGVDAETVLTIPTSDAAAAVFSSLWESINGAGSWDANPWVWVISFKRVESNLRGMTMDAERAIAVLENHNNWRRGADIPMQEPKDLTEAVDIAVAVMKAQGWRPISEAPKDGTKAASA